MSETGSTTIKSAAFVAVDRAQAGIGDRVLLMAEGSSVRAIVGDEKAPIRCAVVGVIDEIAMDGRVVYPES